MNTFNDASRFAWACGVFGLQPGATQQEIRAAILSHLDEANFVPPPAWRQAIWLLSDPKAPQAWPENGYDAFHEALENSLAEDVDAFATAFFSLPRGPRRAKWTELLEQTAAFPRLRARLAAFQPGLDVESATSDSENPQDKVLVDRIRRLFVLKPADQNAQRRQWLTSMTGDWKPVVRRVRTKYPKLAQLEADFLAALALAGRDAVVMNSSVVLADNTNLAASFVTVATTSAAASSRARTKSGSSSGSSSRVSPWMVIWIVFIIGRVVASLNSTQSTYNYTPPPNPSNSRHVYTPPSPPPSTSPSVERDNSENHCRTTQPSGQIREQSGGTDAGWAVSSHVVAALWSAGRGGRRHAIREPVAAVAAAASAQRDRSRLVGPGVSRRLMAMSDRRLPENLDQWPNDPFSLLGVNHASNRREVRRAYAQLIRIYKPEHFPEQFRRIRDAYELLDQRLSWMESNAAAAAERNPFAEDAAVAPAGGNVVEGGETTTDEPAEPQEPLRFAALDRDDLWQKARQGDLAEAYAHYSELAGQGRGDEELYVRLFWMLRLTPEIDPSRDARDWLVAGMKQCGLRRRLPELYRCELLEDPQEALRGRCDEAIRCTGHSGLLTELVIARWGGAAKLQKWEVIAGDLDLLRSRVQDESPVWGRLLLAAIDYLAWTRQDEPRQTLTACRQEIEQVAEHWLPIAGELDQRDVLLELVEACDQMKFLTNLPVEWRKSLRSLLANSWNQPFESCRRQLIEVLAALVQNPVVGLEWLDRLEARCRPALHRFGTLVIMLAAQRGVGQEVPPNEVLRERLIEFLIGLSKKRYPSRWLRWMQPANRRDRSGRLELLMFCLQESVTMRHMTDLLASGVRQDLAQFLIPANSAPLHLICLAYQAFWA